MEVKNNMEQQEKKGIARNRKERHGTVRNTKRTNKKRRGATRENKKQERKKQKKVTRRSKEQQGETKAKRDSTEQ